MYVGNLKPKPNPFFKLKPSWIARLWRIVTCIEPNQKNQPNLDLYLVRRYKICHFPIVVLYLCIGQNQKNQPNLVLYLVRRSKIFVLVATLNTSVVSLPPLESLVELNKLVEFWEIWWTINSDGFSSQLFVRILPAGTQRYGGHMEMIAIFRRRSGKCAVPRPFWGHWESSCDRHVQGCVNPTFYHQCII